MWAGRRSGGQLAWEQAVTANDYIPRPDAQVHAWQNNFVTYFNNHLAELGLVGSDVLDLNDTDA